MKEGATASHWWGRIGLRNHRAGTSNHDGLGPATVGPLAQTNGHHPVTPLEVTADQAVARAGRDGSVPGWDEVVLEKICASYRIGSPADWNVFPGRPSEKRVILTADGREFTVHAINGSIRGTLALKAELDLREFLWQRHYPVAELVRTSGGARYLSVWGYDYVVTVLENAQPYDPTDVTHCVEAATGLAQFHDAARDFAGAAPLGSSPYLSETVDHRLEWVEACLSRHDGDQSFWGRTSHLQHALFSARDELLFLLPGIRAAYEAEPRRLVHGAYDRSALTFDGLGLAEVGNLDRVGLDIRLADLARALLAFCSLQDGDDVSCLDMDPDLVARFLSAYEHLSPLTPIEVEALPLFLRAIHLSKVVDDCRRMLKTPATEDEASSPERNARALCLALQLGFSPGPSRPEDSS
jgi:Ser/Thr protein kinase RdoA (MazF antagonist)